MAAHRNGKRPLTMTCPLCGNRGQHPVAKVDPHNYHCGDATVALFQRIAGTDLSYRFRTKQCIACQEPFGTAEMSIHFLEALVNEVTRLEKENADIQDRATRAVNSNHALDKLLQRISTIATTRLSEQVEALARDPAQRLRTIRAHMRETGSSCGEASKAISAWRNSQRDPPPENSD